MPERRVEYQTIHQGQLSGIAIQAPSLQRVFIDAALAINDFRVSLDLIKEVNREPVKLAAPDVQQLLFGWLDACAALQPSKGFLAYRIVFNQFDGKQLDATLSGESYVSTRHGFARPFSSIEPSGFELSTLSGLEGGFSLRFFMK